MEMHIKLRVTSFNNRKSKRDFRKCNNLGYFNVTKVRNLYYKGLNQNSLKEATNLRYSFFNLKFKPICKVSLVLQVRQ